MQTNSLMKIILMLLCFFATVPAYAAVDSYRFMHVTISTPWYIFIFLLMGVFAPFVLMVVLSWLHAARKAKALDEKADEGTVE